MRTPGLVMFGDDDAEACTSGMCASPVPAVGNPPAPDTETCTTGPLTAAADSQT